MHFYPLMNNSINTAIRVIRSLIFSEKPNYVIAFIDGRCNMYCSFCCHAAKAVRTSPEMSAEQWGYILEGCNSLLQLTITGGEPFVRRDVKEVIESIIISSGVPRVSIRTNGFYKELIKETVVYLLEKFPQTNFTLCISLDGPEKIHDQVRDFKGSYSKALETIDALVELRDKNDNFILRLDSILTDDNKGYMEDFLAETESWPIDYHGIILVRDVPSKIQEGLKDLYSKLSDQQMNRASKKWSSAIDGKLLRTLRIDTLDKIGNDETITPCHAGGRLVEIFPDGVVRGCEVAKLWDISEIGNVNADRIKLVDVLKSREAKDFRKLARTCTCTFECASTVNVAYDISKWKNLI